LKVLHIVESFAPLGGAEQYMIQQISLLADAGIENEVIYWDDHPQTFRTSGYPVYHLTESGPTLLHRIQSIVEADRPTLIYLHTVRDPALIAFVCGLAPTTAYIHDFYPVCPGLAKFYRLGQSICTRPYGLGCVPMIYLRRCASAKHPLSVYKIMQNSHHFLAGYKQARKVMVGSTYMRDLLVQNGLGAEQIAILPYFFQNFEEPPPFPDPADTPRVLFAGRLIDEKGLPHLLRALANVSRPYRLLVAGEGPRKADYIMLADDLGIADKVEFLGWLSPEQMKKVYELAICLIFPSIWPEPFGMVGIEAFQNCRPVIAFDVGGVSDWLEDGRNGYLVPPQNIARLTERIESLLAGPELAAQMGIYGFRYVKFNHEAGRHLQQLLAIFEAVLD
jgi:glycosyltransferase involved in cell wall biosynthesis